MTRPLIRPAAAADRLIVALDVDDLSRADRLVAQLTPTCRFFKIGYWLLLQPGVDRLIDGLIDRGCQVFLDAKIYDIGETVRRGVQSAARRGISFMTVHGDPDILRAAVDGRGDAALRLLAVSVLTSLDDAALRRMGYGLSVRDLLALRVEAAATAGCDGIIASAADNPAALRQLAGRDMLVVTPGIRPAGTATNDHARSCTPDHAIAAGADYLVVGRPITQSDDPLARAESIIALMAGELNSQQAVKPA